MEVHVELVKEIPAGKWHQRSMVRPEETQKAASREPDAAWYASTFALHGHLSGDTSADFDRLPKSGDLYFDFDSPDIEKSRQDCISVMRYLKDSLGVREEHLKAYFSGSKGFHLVVPWHATGLFPRVDLHDVYRKFASGLAVPEICPGGTLDTKIYNSRRCFRIAGSTHQKTGKKKVRLSLADLKTEIADTELASEMGTCSPDVKLRDALLMVREAMREDREEKERLPDEFRTTPLDCIDFALKSGVPQGNRNDTIFTVGLYMKGLGMGEEDSVEIIMRSKLGTLPVNEVRTTIHSAYESKFRFGLRDSVLEPYITQKDRQRWYENRIDEDYATLGSIADEVVMDVERGTGVVAKYHVPELDAYLGGINRGELVVLGASTGTGKSEFAFRVARENAKKGVPSAFISLELPNRDLVRRIIESEAGVDPRSFWSGNMTPEEMMRVKVAAQRMSTERIPLFFRRRKSMMSVDEMEALVKRLATEQHVKFFVIDHLHYFGGRQEGEKENVHVANIIRSLNTLCLKYDVGIVCIAHFRKLPNNMWKPSHHEFRDSSAIEQEASTILVMWRNLDATGPEQNVTEFKLCKSRKDLPLKTIKLSFDRSTRSYVAVGPTAGMLSYEKYKGKGTQE